MPVEIDFLGLQVEKRQQRRPQQNPQQQVPSSIRDIQKAVARLSPDVLRSVIAGNTIRPPRRHVPLPFSSSSTRTSSTAPLTIVYNGTISFFDATHDMAENVMKMAAEGARQLRLQRHLRGRVPAKGVGLIGDMPLLRKKSLQRFLEKRRERLASLAPYAGSASSSVGEVDGTDLSNRH